MGKVKDDLPASKPSKAAAKPSKGGQAGGSPNRRLIVQFLTNLASARLYKPKQGWYARLYTAIGLGVILLFGLLRLHETLTSSTLSARYGIPTALGLALGWAIYRLVQYPPFVEFLIATEAEMNKVSWTTRADLYKATTVVLATVVLMAFFLFGVDRLWLFLLQAFGVLKFGGGDLGSSAG